MIEESHDNLVFALGLIEEMENKATALKELSYWYMDKLNEEEEAIKEQEGEDDGIEESSEGEEKAQDSNGGTKRQWEDFFESFVSSRADKKLGDSGDT